MKTPRACIYLSRLPGSGGDWAKSQYVTERQKQQSSLSDSWRGAWLPSISPSDRKQGRGVSQPHGNWEKIVMIEMRLSWYWISFLGCLCRLCTILSALCELYLERKIWSQSVAPPLYSCESLSLNLVSSFSLCIKSDEDGYQDQWR